MRRTNFTLYQCSLFKYSPRVLKTGTLLITLLTLFFLSFDFQSFAQPTPPSGQKWNLVVNDDFNSFNTSTWGYGSTPWNTENQSDCTIIPASDTYTSGGSLILRSRKGPFTGGSGKSFAYSSGWAWLKTWRKYGYIEIRAQYPNNRGNWAAFWMLADGWPPEIDIAEFRGSPKNYMTMANYNGTWNSTTRTADYTGWHTYGLEWAAGSLKYYIDGVVYKTITGSSVPATAMYVILSNGVDCKDTDGAGFPNNYNVDYFRWYQLAPSSGGGTFNGTYEIVNRNSGKCLHTLNSSTSDGTQVVQYDCNGSASSKWTINQVSSGVYSIVNNASGKYADIEGASGTKGAYNIIWPSNGGNNQKWNITSVSGGYYNIKNVNSGLLLDISGASKDNNAFNIQWNNNGGTNQQWTIRSTASSSSGRIASAESIQSDSQEEIDNGISIYPNPANGQSFTIEMEGVERAEISIFNLDGKLIHRDQYLGKPIIIDTKQFQRSGIYLIRSATNDGKLMTKKLVIE